MRSEVAWTSLSTAWPGKQLCASANGSARELTQKCAGGHGSHDPLATLPKVPGAHEMIGKHAEEAGVGLTKGKVITKTNEDGRVVTMDGEVIGEKGARTCN